MGTSHQLLTFLFVDIVKSTDFKGSVDEEVSKPVFDRCFAIFVECMPGDHAAGKIQTNTGDGMYAWFPLPKDAVETALRIQWRFHGENWPLRRIEVRQGLDMGIASTIFDPVHQEDQPYTFKTHVAARIMDLARPGQILMSRDVRRMLSTTLRRHPFARDESPPEADLTLQCQIHGNYRYKGDQVDDDLNDELLEIAEIRPVALGLCVKPGANDKGGYPCDGEGRAISGWTPWVGDIVPGISPNKWQLERRLGVGGFGTVWLARDLSTDDVSAFKFCDDRLRAQSFVREWKLFLLLRKAVSLDPALRPNIAVLQSSSLQSIKGDDKLRATPPFWIQSDYYPEGNILEWALKRHGIPEDQLTPDFTAEERHEHLCKALALIDIEVRLNLWVELARTVHAVHHHGITHRDIKPTNILIRLDPNDGSPHPVLADFGIGTTDDPKSLESIDQSQWGFRRSDFIEDISHTGTDLYRPQEAVLRTETMQAWDIHALAVLLYQFVRGDASLPLSHSWDQHVNDPILSADIRTGVLDGDKRWRSVAEFAESVAKRDERRRVMEEENAPEQLRNGAKWDEPPYRSLEVFDINHARIFFGRDEESHELRKRLRSQASIGCAFVCIVGASGSGKSSLARAGVAATIQQLSFDQEVKQWRTSVFMPSLNSADLFDALSKSIATTLPELESGVGGTERFAKRLKDNHEAATDLLDTAFKKAFEDSNGVIRLLLIVDQMEELWTDPSITPEIRDKFFAAIELLAGSGHVSVLATLRTDFYPQAQRSEIFLRMKGVAGHFDLLPPGPAALRELIVQPARLSGITFEGDPQTGRTLDQQILEDATSEGAVLPLLQYALNELYEKRDKKQCQLTLAAYEAMKGKAKNGVEGAIGQRASETFNLLPSNAQAALDEILPLLVSVDDKGEHQAVRRRALLDELKSTPSRKLLTESLTSARFLTTDRKGEVAVASLAHEALLRCWDRIVAWIDANLDLLRMRSQLEQSQHRWEQSSKEDSLLLHGRLPLSEGRQLLTKAVHLLGPATQEYVSKSIAYYLAGVIASGLDVTERAKEIEEQHPIEWRNVVAGAFVSSNANVRKNVADLVANRPSAEFQDELITLVTCDEVEAVRAAAAQALVSRGRRDAYDKIRDSLVGGSSSTLRGSPNALALLKATSDMQKTKLPFAGWFDDLPISIQWPAHLMSYAIRFKAAIPTFIFVLIPAMIFAVAGAGSVKWLPSWLDYSCVQGAASLGMGFFHAAPSGIILGGGVVFGLTLYRMVFGREYDEASLLRPLPTVAFGAVSGLLMGVLCVVMIASIYNQQGLYVMGWIDVGTKPEMSDFLYDLFFKNLCGLGFPLTSIGFGLASALMTNNLRGSLVWKEFLERQSTLSTMKQLIGVTKGLVRLTIPYAWPIPAFVSLFAVIALVVMNSADRPEKKGADSAEKWAFPLVAATFTGGLDAPEMKAQLEQIRESKKGLKPSGNANDPDQMRLKELKDQEFAIRSELDDKIRKWKTSFAGLALGLFGDCLAKIVGGYFCIVGMGVGIVMLRHGINIEARKV